MDLYALAGEVRSALAGVTPTLRVYEFGADIVQPPAAALFMYDATLHPHETFGPGGVWLEGPRLFVVVRDPNPRTSSKALAAYLRRTGASSVKAALEGYAWTQADVCTVTQIDVLRPFKIGGADLAGAELHLDFYGTGT